MQIPSIAAASPPAKRAHPLPTLAASLLLALTLAACGGKEMVQGDNLALGASSIEMAQAAGGDEFATVEMSSARQKLERARRLLQDGKREDAQRLADEADADAQVAQSKATYMRSAKSLAEVQASIAAMRAQTTRTAP